MLILFFLNCRLKHLQIKDWKSPRQVESHSSYQHSFYGVYNRHILVFYRRQSVFREHILKKDTLPCLIVKSSSGEKEESVRKKDISLSAEKESLKGSRKVRLLERARKKSGQNDIQVSNKKNLHKVLKVESCQKIAACDPQSLP